MNTVLSKPCAHSAVIRNESATSDILTAKKCRDIIRRFLHHILCSDALTAVIIVAAKPENMVYILLGKRKSEGRLCNTLRFINIGDLFTFRGEEAQLNASRRRWFV